MSILQIIRDNAESKILLVYTFRARYVETEKPFLQSAKDDFLHIFLMRPVVLAVPCRY